MGHKIASIALGLLITFSANTQSLAQKDYPYNISGNLTNRVNTKIYLAVHANIPNSKKTIIDSVQVKDGNFNLEGSAPIGMYALFVRKNDQWKQIFLDGNEIKITGNNDSLYNSKVTGSKELDVLNTWMKKSDLSK